MFKDPKNIADTFAKMAKLVGGDAQIVTGLGGNQLVEVNIPGQKPFLRVPHRKAVMPTAQQIARSAGNSRLATAVLNLAR